MAFVNFVLDSRATVKEAQTLSLHSSSDLTMNVYDRTHKNRLSEIVEDLADNLKLNEKCVQNVYFSEEAEQRKSATLRNYKELRSSKMVEAAGIEPASEISSPQTSTCVVMSLDSRPHRCRLTKPRFGPAQ